MHLSLGFLCNVLYESRDYLQIRILTLETLSFKFFLTWLNNKFLDSFEILGLWNWNCLDSWIFYLMHLKELFVWRARVLKGEMIKVYKAEERINMNLFTKFCNIRIRWCPLKCKDSSLGKIKRNITFDSLF